MGFDLGVSVPAAVVFLQGILSFFSPCVLPLVPLYVGYLAGGAGPAEKQGRVHDPRKRILVNTLFFVLGISFTFFLLGLGFTALGRFFTSRRVLFARVSGVIMILLGLYQFGVFGREGFLERERRLPFRLDRWTMNPLVALALGFTFSFAWTPCVGPALGSVLLMASSAGSAGVGFGLIGVYTLGFVLPFLAVGLFTGTVLRFFKRNQNVVRYTVKVGAAVLIVMGLMTLTGYMNGLTSYLSSLGDRPAASSPAAGAPSGGDISREGAGPTALPGGEGTSENTPEPTDEPDPIRAPDFTLTDQNGVEHTLSDYQGKTVFLNFWATWCGPCKNEMPHIQELYEAYGENEGEELIVLGVANPRSGDYPKNIDVTREEVERFLEENQYSFPTVMDTEGSVFASYGIMAYPTTFMIDREGNLFGYVQGAMTYEMMESVVEQTITGVRK